MSSLKCFTVQTHKQNHDQKKIIRSDIRPRPLPPLSVGQFSYTPVLLSHTAVFISAGQCGHGQVSFCSLYCSPWLGREGCHASCHIELVLISPQPQDASGVFWKLSLFSSPILPSRFFSHALSGGLFLSLSLCVLAFSDLSAFSVFFTLCFPSLAPHLSGPF